jgi:hypothetical protein
MCSQSYQRISLLLMTKQVQEIIDNVTKSSTGLFDLLQHSPLKMDPSKSLLKRKGVGVVLNRRTTLDVNYVCYKKTKRLLSARKRNDMIDRRAERLLRSASAGQSQGVPSLTSSSSSENERNVGWPPSRLQSSGFGGLAKPTVGSWLHNQCIINGQPPLKRRPELFGDSQSRGDPFELHDDSNVIVYHENPLRLHVLSEEMDSCFSMNFDSVKSTPPNSSLSPIKSSVNYSISKVEFKEEDKESLEQELLQVWTIKVESDVELQNTDFRSCSACKDRYVIRFVSVFSSSSAHIVVAHIVFSKLQVFLGHGV